MTNARLWSFRFVGSLSEYVDDTGRQVRNDRVGHYFFIWKIVKSVVGDRSESTLQQRAAETQAKIGVRCFSRVTNCGRTPDSKGYLPNPANNNNGTR